MSKDISQRAPIITWSDWKKAKDAEQVTEAEIKLVEACVNGVACRLGEERPETCKPENEIGADLLRYLIKGGRDAPDLHDWGVDVRGAYVTGLLDLRMIDAVGVTSLINCHFDAKIEALNAKFNMLNLPGSACPGLVAQGITVAGGVFLRDGFSAKGEVSLSGAVIGGQLDCTGGCFENAAGDAINAQGAEVKGSVFLCNGFSAKGEACLASAVIGGQLDCTGGRFENAKGDAINAQGPEVKGDVFLSNEFSAKGEVSLSGAVIGGQLACVGGRFENAKGDAINAQDARMGSFFWREVQHCEGRIRLIGTQAQDIADDAESWALVEHISLDGFTYGAIYGPLDAQMRLRWLERAKAYDGEFSPQPYEQLATVLRRMGHSGTARIVQRDKEAKSARDWTRRSREQQAKLRKARDGEPAPANHSEIQRELGQLWFDMRIIPFWHWALKVLVGFGYAPQRAVWWAIGTIILSGFFYQLVWGFGGIVPNSDVILASASWAEAMCKSPGYPSVAFLASDVGRHYEAFNAFAYAAGIFIPLVNFGQERAWTATTATTLGGVAWVATWGIKAFGWIVTALGAAAITGIIRRE